MNKFGQAVQAAELLMNLLREAQLAVVEAEEDRDESEELQAARSLMEAARAELDKTSGSLVQFRNLYLTASRELEQARKTIRAQESSLAHQGEELRRLDGKLMEAERAWDELRMKNTELMDERLALNNRVNELEETAAGLRRENSELRAEAGRVTRLAEAAGVVTTG